MSVKKEASGRRSVQVEVEVPGTPEEVWRAIATGTGISSWFVPTKVEERGGGAMTLDFGPGMECRATVTDWQPPRRFSAESNDWGPGAPAVATEWIVEARSGGLCVVRVVHSLFASTDDWDNQLEGVESGWPTFFRILRLYLTHFRGLRCTNIQVSGCPAGSESAAWAELTGALGLSGAQPGQRYRSGQGAPRLAGVIEAIGEGKHPHWLIARLDEPASGVAYFGAYSCGGPVQTAANFYLYGDRSTEVAAREEPAWRKWMNATFPQTADAGRV